MPAYIYGRLKRVFDTHKDAGNSKLNLPEGRLEFHKIECCKH